MQPVKTRPSSSQFCFSFVLGGVDKSKCLWAALEGGKGSFKVCLERFHIVTLLDHANIFFWVGLLVNGVLDFVGRGKLGPSDA